MVPSSPPPSLSTAAFASHWRRVLSPWLRALTGKLSLSLSPARDVLPTREDLAAIAINVSMARVGHDRGLWSAVLEALELLQLVFYIDPLLCWSLLLAACGRSLEAHQSLAFPVAWLAATCPTYVLCFLEVDLADGFEQISDIFDVVVMGVAEWNHSPQFPHVSAALLSELVARQRRDNAVIQVQGIALSCLFVFNDDPVQELDDRLDSLAAIRNLAAFLTAYQDLGERRMGAESPYFVTSFDLEFGDCMLLAPEMDKVIGLIVDFPVTSLSFSLWDGDEMPPGIIENLCLFALAPVQLVEPCNLHRGLHQLTFCPLSVPPPHRSLLCQGIGDSSTLRQVTFCDDLEARDERVEWLEHMLAELFGGHVRIFVEAVRFKLVLSSAQDVVAARRLLDANCDRVGAILAASAAPPTSVPESTPPPVISPVSSPVRPPAEPKLRERVVELVSIDLYRYSFHDFTDPAGNVHVSHDIKPRPPPHSLPPRIATACATEESEIVLPPRSLCRMVDHKVRHLTISLDPDRSSETTVAAAVELVWIVGEPLTRLTISGRDMIGGLCSEVSASELEQLLTACPHLERLELLQLEIESLDPLVDASLSSGLQAIVIDRSRVQNRRSVADFFAALSDPTHHLHLSLVDLFICEGDQDDEGDIEFAYAVLKMLAKNTRLERFVLRGRPDGVALKLRGRLAVFHDQPVVDADEPPLATEAKIAILSVLAKLPVQCNAYKQFDEGVVGRIFAFAASPCRRHCTVVAA